MKLLITQQEYDRVYSLADTALPCALSVEAHKAFSKNNPTREALLHIKAAMRTHHPQKDLYEGIAQEAEGLLRSRSFKEDKKELPEKEYIDGANQHTVVQLNDRVNSIIDYLKAKENK